MNTKFIFLFLIFIFSLNLVFAQENTCIYFFYGDGCQHCAKTEPFIKQIESKYDNLEVKSFEIYNNRSNSLLLNEFFEVYDIPDKNRGIPVIFISSKYLIGDLTIINNFEKYIIENSGADCPKLNGLNGTGVIGASSPIEKLKSLSILTVIGAAIVDSINPCAIAVLLILLGTLLMTGNKKKAVKAGFAFTLSIYISYFLFGLGLFSALQISGLSYWFYKTIGILAILIGLANIKDFFWYGGAGFIMEIPRSWRPKLKDILGKVTTPFGAFLMGFIVCLFELPCTGGPYIVILGLLAEKTTQLLAIPILLLYNLFFVLPLILITLMIYLGFTNVEKTTEWKEKNIRMLHLIAGIIMFILGLLVIFNLI